MVITYVGFEQIYLDDIEIEYKLRSIIGDSTSLTDEMIFQIEKLFSPFKISIEPIFTSSITTTWRRRSRFLKISKV